MLASPYTRTCNNSEPRLQSLRGGKLIVSRIKVVTSGGLGYERNILYCLDREKEYLKGLRTIHSIGFPHHDIRPPDKMFLPSSLGTAHMGLALSEYLDLAYQQWHLGQNLHCALYLLSIRAMYSPGLWTNATCCYLPI